VPTHDRPRNTTINQPRQ
jgi:hypothetical protein